MTLPERLVWAVLRSRGLKGWKFRRQVPIGPFIVDFLCAEARLVVEIDGASHDTQQAYDRQRERYLQCVGYRVLRLTNEQVFDELEGSMMLVLAELDKST